MDKRKSKELVTIIKLLKETTTIKIVQEYLKSKSLHFSASSWDTLESNRIVPYVKESKVSIDELKALLGSVEEFGKQHIFLYKCSSSTAKNILNSTRIEQIADELELTTLINEPSILDEPSEPTISDLRYDQKSLVIKITETRVSRELISEEENGDQFVQTYGNIKIRGINVIKLHSDGLLEIRIQSHTQRNRSGLTYVEDIDKVFRILEPFFDRTKFRELSLAQAKTTLWEDKEKLSDIIRYTNVEFKDDIGGSLRAAVLSQDDNITDDVGLTSSLENYSDYDAYCNASNFWFIEKDPVPSRKVHILLSGTSVNEFAIPQNCTEPDYDYVLQKIRKFNKANS